MFLHFTDCKHIFRYPDHLHHELMNIRVTTPEDLFLRQRGLCSTLPGIFLSNVRSLHNKLDEQMLLLGENRDFSSSAVLCLTETWLCGWTPDSALLQLAGFKLHRAERHGAFGFLHQQWLMQRRDNDHCSPDLECFITNCKPFCSPREFASFIRICVYIPPHANLQDARRMLPDRILAVERSFSDWDIFKTVTNSLDEYTEAVTYTYDSVNTAVYHHRAGWVTNPGSQPNSEG